MVYHNILLPRAFYTDAINLLKIDILLEIYSCKEYKVIGKSIELIFAHLDEGREFYCIFDNGNIVLARIIAREKKKLLLKCVKIPSTKLKWSFTPWRIIHLSTPFAYTNTSTKIELVYRNFMELKTYRITIVQCTLEGSIVLLKIYFAYLERIMAF